MRDETFALPGIPPRGDERKGNADSAEHCPSWHCSIILPGHFETVMIDRVPCWSTVNG
jgi:hypothetical protein